jgi:FecR protein
MQRLSIYLLVAFPLLVSPLAAQAASAVGNAAAVRNDVRGSIAGQLSTGSPVYQSETVSTGADSTTQLLFLDKTSLTVGPTSQIRIDKFVYDPNRGAKGTTVSLAKGALRVVTGSKNPEDFTVQTPLAYTGVRGSVGQIYVSLLRYEFFLNIEGHFRVCVRGGPCQDLDRPGYFIIVSPDGSMSPPAPWPGPMLDPTMSVAALETYFSNIIRRNYDVLPRFRDLNDALKSKDFSPSCFGEGC